MATVSIPYTFVNGSQNADATQVNSNFSTLASFLNTEVIQRDASVAFTQIPTLPSTAPTNANHAVRKGYVDGFFPVTSANIADGTIVNADVNASAAIAYSKLSLASSLVVGDFATGVRPVIIVANAAARTALTGVVEGQLVYQSDNDRLLSYTGTSWRVEVDSGSYTPTVENLSVGTGGTNNAVYSYSRGVLTVSGLITLGTGGSVSGNVLISYPSGFQTDPIYETDSPIGTTTFNVGGSQFIGIMSYNSGTRMKPLVSRYNPSLATSAEYATISGTSASIPATWASGSDLRWIATINGTISA